MLRNLIFMTNSQNQNRHIAMFKSRTIRKTIFNKEWYFSVVDIVGVLIDQPDYYTLFQDLGRQ